MVSFKMAPRMTPRPCIGSLLDIPFGEYYTGKYGDRILNGGLPPFMGIGARGNMYKSALALSIALRVFHRYNDGDENIGVSQYDTELSASWRRLENIGQTYDETLDVDAMASQQKIVLTNRANYLGNEWWALVVEQGKERYKAKRSISRETPFLDEASKPIKAIPPFIHLLDSLSEFRTKNIDLIYEKNEIGDSSTNTAAMRDGAVKTQLIHQVPNVTAETGLFLIATAHLGDEIKTDEYAPWTQKLQYMKKGVKFKDVPEKFTFLTSAAWTIIRAEALLRKEDKTPEYPKQGRNETAGDPDLQKLTLVNVRSKYGPTGHLFELLVSQSDGLLPSLSEYHYLKTRKDKFGLQGPEGIHKDYRLSLYPDVVLKRTRVRDTIDNDPKLRRALEITTELCQIYEYWSTYPEKEKVSPEELRRGLEEKGYDWNRLLETRGYWTFDHYTNPVPPLSTMDLINMYFDRYVPFWYNQTDSSSSKSSKTASKNKGKSK